MCGHYRMCVLCVCACMYFVYVRVSVVYVRVCVVCMCVYVLCDYATEYILVKTKSITEIAASVITNRDPI